MDLFFALCFCVSLSPFTCLSLHETRAAECLSLGSSIVHACHVHTSNYLPDPVLRGFLKLLKTTAWKTGQSHCSDRFYVSLERESRGRDKVLNPWQSMKYSQCVRAAPPLSPKIHAYFINIHWISESVFTVCYSKVNNLVSVWLRV